MLSALVLLSISDLACGLAANSTVLYIFRGLAGAANGGIVSLSQMIVSDVVTLKERGKYQGILGCMVGLGNALGPLIASAFAVNRTWRGVFYLLVPLILITVVASWKSLPSNMPELNLKEAVAKIDILGLITGTAAVILILIPTSEGGHAGTPWDSPVVIAMFTVGGICLIAFILIEWKWAKLPMMPLGMFKNVSVAVMLLQAYLLGACYYTFLYFLTLYLQNVRGKSPLVAAALQLPLVGAHSIFSPLAGYLQSRRNSYIEIIWFGFGTLTLGAGLLTLCNEMIPLGWFCLFLVFIGTGTGCVWQTTLTALQAHCSKAERAVVISNRNCLRSFGAGVGLAASSAILANVFKASLPPRLASVANSTFALPDLSGYSAADQATIIHAYSAATRAVFIWCVPLIGVCFLLCAFVKDKSLEREEEREALIAPSENAEKDSRTSAADLENGRRQYTRCESEIALKSTPADEVSLTTTPEISRKSSRQPASQIWFHELIYCGCQVNRRS